MISPVWWMVQERLENCMFLVVLLFLSLTPLTVPVATKFIKRTLVLYQCLHIYYIFVLTSRLSHGTGVADLFSLTTAVYP